MEIGLAGDGPAAEAVAAAFGDTDVDVVETDPADLGSYGLGVVVASTGGRAFWRANEVADRWVAVEVGGVGGHGIDGVDAAVSIFDAESGCYDCLSARVAATLDSDGETKGVRSAVRFAGAVAGRRAIRLLSGEDLAGTVVEVPGAERSFLSVPHCSCGEDPDPRVPMAYRDVDVETAVSRAERAVDDRVGIVSQIGERESYPAPYYIAQVSDTSGFSDVQAAGFAAGVDPDWDRAFMKALGEALERYCAGVYRRDRFWTAPAAEVDGAVPPGRFVRPDDYPSPDADEDVEWFRGVELGEGSLAHLPAEFVHYPPAEARFKPSITTGLGLGNSGVEAVLSGLYEVLERDATMLGWYSTFEPMGLSVDDEAFDALAKRAESEGLTVTPLLVTQDVDVPVVAVAVHRDSAWPKFAVGSSADLDATAAARGALAEAIQNWMELRAMGPDQAADEGGKIGHYAGFPRPAREFVDAETTLDASTVSTDASGEAELDALLGRVDDAGLTAYASRITTRDVATLGFEAVRVLVPGAQPLFTGDPYFGERLESVPPSMGFEPRPNRAYHPYP